MSGSRLQVTAMLAKGDFALDVEFTAALGAATAIFGPSGAGKSTLLRVIAGLDRPQSGRIAFNDDVWFDAAAGRFTPAHRRRVGIVFQHAHLFPHLSVAGNLAYADRRRAAPAPGFDMATVTERFDLGDLADRAPDSLSGGERQRVAIARALLSGPRLLLLDEPLAALDRKRKREILPYLEALTAEFDLPVIYVSHAVDEVVRLAGQTLLLENGAVAAFGATADVLSDCGDSDGDAVAIIRGVVASGEGAGLVRVAIGDQYLSLPAPNAAKGDVVAVRIAARDVAIALERPAGISIRNILPARVAAIDAHGGGPFAFVSLAVGDASVPSQITRASLRDLNLEVGASVFALVKSASFDG